MGIIDRLWTWRRSLPPSSAKQGFLQSGEAGQGAKSSYKEGKCGGSRVVVYSLPNRLGNVREVA
jgi:hypothetical protein